MCNAVEQAKEEVMWGVRSMVEKGYALGTAGNISARVKGEELFLLLPLHRDHIQHLQKRIYVYWICREM